jgi:hypothetical protein
MPKHVEGLPQLVIVYYFTAVVGVFMVTFL